MHSAHHVNKRILSPRFLSQIATYDQASTIHQCLYQTYFEPSFPELNDIL